MRVVLFVLMVAIAGCSPSATATSSAPSQAPSATSTPSPADSPTPQPSLVEFEGTITFSRDDEIYEISQAGERQLTSGEREASGQWSPDGSLLAFQSYRDGDADIYVLTADGRNAQKIVDLPGDEIDPRWSPNGQRIVFWHYADPEPTLYTVRPDGSELADLETPEGCTTLSDWAEFGLLITQQESGNENVYRVVPGSCSKVRLTSEPGQDVGAVLSPDGTKIAFWSSRDGGGIYVMTADGSEQTRILANDFGIRNASLTWSPDGSRIAWVGKFEGEGLRGTPIYVMRSDGSELGVVTASPVTALRVSWRQP